MQYEAMGESPSDIKKELGFYDPSCGGKWQYSRYAGVTKRRSHRQVMRAINALSGANSGAIAKKRRKH
jgi:hypothetical protein